MGLGKVAENSGTDLILGRFDAVRAGRLHLREACQKLVFMKTSTSALQFLLFMFAGWTNRRQLEVIEYLKEENRVLRERLGGRRVRLSDDQRRRLAAKGKALGRKGLEETAGIVSPDTILRWYRKLVGGKYDGSKNRRTGRPPTAKEIAGLVVRIARENPRFGYTRIRDVLCNLGHSIGRNTVKRIMLEHGLEPAPQRTKTSSWRTFIKAHMDAGTIAAADFFTVEVLSLFGIVRYHVFFVMQLATRRVHVAGITPQPCDERMKQMSRNLTDMVDGFLLGMRYLIMDRDPLFSRSFQRILKDSGVNPVRLPARSPNLNAYATRFVLSIKSECLDRMIFLGERHLREAVSDYVLHYHIERQHQGLDAQLIEPDETAWRSKGRVVCRERQGGMLRYYYREAA